MSFQTRRQYLSSAEQRCSAWWVPPAGTGSLGECGSSAFYFTHAINTFASTREDAGERKQVHDLHRIRPALLILPPSYGGRDKRSVWGTSCLVYLLCSLKSLRRPRMHDIIVHQPTFRRVTCYEDVACMKAPQSNSGGRVVSRRVLFASASKSAVGKDLLSVTTAGFFFIDQRL